MKYLYMSKKQRLIHGVVPSQFCAGDKEGSKDTCESVMTMALSEAVSITNYSKQI